MGLKPLPYVLQHRDRFDAQRHPEAHAYIKMFDTLKPLCKTDRDLTCGCPACKVRMCLLLLLVC